MGITQFAKKNAMKSKKRSYTVVILRKRNRAFNSFVGFELGLDSGCRVLTVGKQGSCEYQFYTSWYDPTRNQPRSCRSRDGRSYHSVM